MSEDFDYVNFHYGVNACVGRRVVAYGKPGTIVKDYGHYIGVVLDSDPHASPGRYHPTDGIIYGEVVDYKPPKLNSHLRKAKRNYQEFQDADCGYDFHEWLGIERPRVDYDNGKCRMYRISYDWKPSIYGEWCNTKKAAKASYKDALRKSKGATA